MQLEPDVPPSSIARAELLPSSGPSHTRSTSPQHSLASHKTLVTRQTPTHHPPVPHSALGARPLPPCVPPRPRSQNNSTLLCHAPALRPVRASSASCKTSASAAPILSSIRSHTGRGPRGSLWVSHCVEATDLRQGVRVSGRFHAAIGICGVGGAVRFPRRLAGGGVLHVSQQPRPHCSPHHLFKPAPEHFRPHSAGDTAAAGGSRDVHHAALSMDEFSSR